MNATTQAIIERLREIGKPILQAADIAAAYGFQSTNPILADIKTGKVAANKRPGGPYVISLEAAEAYVAANEYQPEEGTIKK